MKEMIKMVVIHFFIITVSVLFCTGISELASGTKSLCIDYPFIIIITGIVGALPSFLFYFRNEPTQKQFWLRMVIHFFIVEGIIICEGAFVDWYHEFLEALILFLMVLFIYLFVVLCTFIMYRNTANEINKALRNQLDKE